MNETINNEIEMNEIETAAELDIDNVIPLDYEVSLDESGDEGNLGAVIFGISALAGAVVGGIALAKKMRKDDKKDGFIKKMAVKYLTKKGCTVVEPESVENDEGVDADDYDGLVPDEK